jgi:glyoxylase-like metal-dependent hydrolase (beta-lactamase superfamily II)
MHIHAIQTGSVAIKTHQMRGQGHGSLRLVNTLLDPKWTEPLPIYAWVIEHPEGLIVIDTGETARTAERGYFPWWHPFFKLAARPEVHPEDEIGPQLRARGIAPGDVRWVVVTHLHTDHAGGLHHFPKATILVSRAEHQAASGFRGQINGYLPQHWPGWFAPQLIDFASQPLGVFPNSYTLTSAGDVHLVPTPGHTFGHLSVIMQEDEHALFFAGDTSYTQQLMLEQVIDGVTSYEALYQQTARQIRSYVQATPTIYLPSHDPASAQRLVDRTAIA